MLQQQKIYTIIYHIIRRGGRILGGKEADDDRPYMVAVMINLDGGSGSGSGSGDDEYVEYYDDVGGGKARSKQAGKRSDKPKGKIQGK